jgi:alkaline phosphatase
MMDEYGGMIQFLLQTYNIDRQVPDSAGTATALFSGVKANFYTVGLDAGAQFNVCRTEVEAQAKVSSIIDWAIAAGKSTGKATSTSSSFLSFFAISFAPN